MSEWNGQSFLPADLLLPAGVDWSKWSVVACDQYTSEPEYWSRVEEQVGEAPSALRLILPECRLEDGRTEEHIAEINNTMESYLSAGIWRELPQSFVYVERTQDNGAVRCGLVGAVDLEQYDYRPEAGAPIRATEGTVLSRIPPRLRVRRNAAVELSHVMLLADDPENTVIGPVSRRMGKLEKLYDFPLMERGGSVRGFAVDKSGAEQIGAALAALADRRNFEQKYGIPGAPVLLFAVGDGNHSLATAKAAWEEKKQTLPPEQWAWHPARYAMVEVVNLHDPSLVFEPIHRVVFGVDPEKLIAELLEYYPDARQGGGGRQRVRYVYDGGEGEISFDRPRSNLAVGTLQRFLDERLPENASLDYIHGGDVAERLGRQRGNIGFILSPMKKSQLFETVIRDGVLPRKTFSMGEAHDKRFYLESRKIR